MLREFVKLYTPFICAVVSIAHISLYLYGYNGSFYGIFNNLTGHSILMMIFILYHSRRMCKRYKLSCWLLLFIHINNIIYHLGFEKYDISVLIILLLSIGSLLSWLIFRVTYKTTKVIRSACKRLEELEKSQSHTSAS